MGAFGATIPVISLNNGFLGAVSRIGERVIAARQVLSTTPNPINFGDTVVLVGDSLGGTWQSVKDFIAGGGTFTAAKLAGFAVREVKTNLQFQSLVGATSAPIGQYPIGSIAEVLEKGSCTVAVNNGTPVAGASIYVRVALNGAIPAGVVGGVEAVADGANTVVVPNVVFRTGVLDGNNVAEVAILTRQVA